MWFWIFLQTLSHFLLEVNGLIRKSGLVYCLEEVNPLTHWGRVMHKCVSKLTIIDSDNGLAPGRPQTIIWTNTGMLLIGPLATNFGEILFGIYIFSFKKMHLKMSSGKWRPFCLGLNVLKYSSHCATCDILVLTGLPGDQVGTLLSRMLPRGLIDDDI